MREMPELPGRLEYGGGDLKGGIDRLGKRECIRFGRKEELSGME
jgi:hypothetical protein